MPGYWQWESVFEVEAVISNADCGSNVAIPHGDLFPVSPDYALGALEVTMECSFVLQGDYVILWTMHSFWDWFRIDPGPDPPTFHVEDNATSGQASYHVE